MDHLELHELLPDGRIGGNCGEHLSNIPSERGRIRCRPRGKFLSMMNERGSMVKLSDSSLDAQRMFVTDHESDFMM